MNNQLLKIIKNYLIDKRFWNLSIPFHVKMTPGIKIDKRVSIDRNCKIGKYSYIGRFTIITKTIIGNYCSIGPNAKIGLGEHDYLFPTTSVRVSKSSYNDLTEKECTIGHDVWIGTGSVILRGTKIGNGAVIGANAVVTKDVPPFAIVVGVPAKILKYRFNEEKRGLIIESNWWDHSPQIAAHIINNLNV